METPWLFSALHFIMGLDITPLWDFSKRKSACSPLLFLTNRLSLFGYSVCFCGWYKTPSVADFRQPVLYLSTHKFGIDACFLSYTICPLNTQWSIGNSKIANPHCSGIKNLQICVLSKNVSANPKKTVTAVSNFLLHLFIFWGVGCAYHSMPMKIKGQLTGVSRLSPSITWVPGIKLRWAGSVVGTFIPWVTLPALAAFFCYLLRRSLPVAQTCLEFALILLHPLKCCVNRQLWPKPASLSIVGHWEACREYRILSCEGTCFQRSKKSVPCLLALALTLWRGVLSHAMVTFPICVCDSSFAATNSIQG